jgi:hypothetical protein
MEHMEYQQRQLALLGELREPVYVEEYFVERWRSEHDAIATCWAKRRVRYSVRNAAAMLGIPASHLSNILSGKKYLPNDFRINFQLLCGNWAIRQYEDRVCCFITSRETPEQRELRSLRVKVAGYEKRVA